MAVKGAGPPPSTEPESWPNRPVYFCAHPDTHTKDYEAGAPLPLDKIIEFETDLFVGRIICRLKPISPTNNTNDKDDDHDESPAENQDKQAQDEYFKTKSTLYQFVLQGQFRKEIPLSDLVLGDVYEKPLIGVPKGLFMRMYERFMESMYPGMIMDMTSEEPKSFTSLASVQVMRVDLPGNQPNLNDKAVLNDLQEDTTLLFANPSQTPTKLPREGTTTCSSKRRGHLSKPKNGIFYHTNPDHVYTIELCDNATCFGSYYQYAIGFRIDMAKCLNGQPLCYAIFRKQSREMVCKFPVWHERLLDEMMTKQEATAGAKAKAN